MSWTLWVSCEISLCDFVPFLCRRSRRRCVGRAREFADDIPTASTLAAATIVAMGTGYWPLIASHACTKLGSKAWEFATPLLLLQFSDGTLLAPTLFGLCVFLFKFVFGPAAGRWMDCTARWRVVIMGLLLQAIGVLGALGVLWLLWTLCPPGQATQMPWVLLGAMIACGAAEALGALVSSVAVKKDWVPSIWAPTDPDLASGTRFFPPSHTRPRPTSARLSLPASPAYRAAVNTAMANIDLVAEIFGPLAAGTAMQLLGQSSGFVLVGAVSAEHLNLPGTVHAQLRELTPTAVECMHR